MVRADAERFRVRPWQVAAVTVSIAILWVLAQSQMSALRSGRPLVREFMAFYTVGHVLNHSPQILYDPEVFNATYHSLFPVLPQGVKQLYAHAPFEAIAFRPFAVLPFESALVAWQMFSVVLFCVGFTLVWRGSQSLPWGQLPLALLLMLSFRPIAVDSIARGQVAALVFFWMALALWCQRRRRDYWAGVALSLCLSKPTLLGLLVPMLIVGYRHRILIGFGAGAAALGAVSLSAVGWRGCADYGAMLLRFGTMAAGPRTSFLLSDYVDLNSFVRMAVGGRGIWAMVVLALMTAAVLPRLVRLWRALRREREVESGLTWAATLTWTMLLNVYVAPYDTPIVLLGMVLAAGALYGSSRDMMPRAVRVFLVLLYVVPWIPAVPIAIDRTLHLYTLVLVGLGVYQIREAMSATGRPGPAPAHGDFAPK
jgi:Glycosyltransferase family 87